MEGKGKGLFARLAAIAATVVAVFALALPAYAAGLPATVQITGFDPSEDPAVSSTVYQIVVPETSGDGAVTGYKWSEVQEGNKQSVKDWVATYERGKYSNIKDFDSNKVNANDAKAFYDSLAAAIRGGSVFATPVGTPLTKDGSITVNEAGNYLVVTSGGEYIYEPAAFSVATNGEVNANGTGADAGKVVVKSSKPKFDKKANEETQIKGAQIGDVVNFDLRGDVPQYPANATYKSLRIGDNLSEGLTLDVNSIKVYGVSGKTETLLTGDRYSLNTTNAQTTVNDKTVSLDFLVSFDKSQYEQLVAAGYTRVHIDYNATLNSKAKLGSTGNPNEAYYEYNNNPYDDSGYKQIPGEDKVYSYGLKIKKVDKTSNQTLLSGAKFKVTKDNVDVAFVKVSEGVYRVFDSKSDKEADKVTEVEVGSSDALKGQLTLNGLGLGTYQLTETQAPDGYFAPADPFSFMIKDNNTDGTPENDKNSAGDSDGYLSYTAENSKGFNLPQTGGAGTLALTAGGVVLVSVAAFMLLRKRSGR